MSAKRLCIRWSAAALSAVMMATGVQALTSGVAADVSTKFCFRSVRSEPTKGVWSMTEDVFPYYDSEGAENVVLTKRCTITSASVWGAYGSITSAAYSETVNIYADDGGPHTPGRLLSSQTLAGTDDNGNFTIPLEPITLDPGSYWVSVVAHVEYGEWYWTRSHDNEHRLHSGLWRTDATPNSPGQCYRWRSVLFCYHDGYGQYQLALAQ